MNRGPDRCQLIGNRILCLIVARIWLLISITVSVELRCVTARSIFILEISTLDHEVVNDSVENHVVVFSSVRQFDEVIDMNRCGFSI